MVRVLPAFAVLLFGAASLAQQSAPAKGPPPGNPSATSTAEAPAHPAAPAQKTPGLAPPLAAPAGPASTPANNLAETTSIAGSVVQAIQTPSDPEAWGGQQDPKGPVLSQRVASYELKAVLDPKAHTVEGSEVLHWKNRSKVPVQTVYFHLYLNGFEGPGSTWLSEKKVAGAFRSGAEQKKGEWGWIDVASVMQGGKAATLSFVHPDNGPETDRSVLRADLPAPVAPGATVDLAIQFHDQLPRVIARTGYWGSYHLVGQWFPKIGVLELPGERGATAPRWNVHEFHENSEFYADFGNYDLEITAPKGFTVAATGERVGEPVETPAGVVHKFHQDDIHDAVFTAWDKYMAPLEGTYQGPGSPTVTVETYFSAEDRHAGEMSQQATLDSLKYFSETLGAYPYRHVTVIVPPYNAPESGGMEYETFFTSDRASGPTANLTRFVAIHEFGHGYFMGLLATNEFEEPFLDEGMNELWDERMLDGETLVLPLGLADKLGFGFSPFSYWDALERAGRGPNIFVPDPVTATAWKRNSNGSYYSIYPRTAILFHDLEVELGGDTFARGMKLYYTRWHHRHPSTADLRAALVDGAEKPADKELIKRWFDTQVYAPATVDDAVTSVESDELKPEPGTEIVDGGRVELDEKGVHEAEEAAQKAFDAAEADAGTAKKEEVTVDGHKFKPGPYPFRSEVRAVRRGAQIPQTLLVKFEDGSSQTLLWPPGESWHHWVFDGPARVDSAQLDPEGKLFLDVNKLDDGRTRQEKSKAAHRWTLEIMAWAQLVFAMVGAL